MPKRNLFDDNEVSDYEGKLVINQKYAENYENWRRKEDYQKLKDKYGDTLNAGDSDTDTSEEDGLTEPDNPEFDMDFFRVLAAIRLNHPILKEKEKFFKESYAPKNKTKNSSKENGPLTVKDFERRLILERRGKYEDEEDQPGPSDRRNDTSLLIKSENQKKFAFDDNLTDDEMDDLFIKKEKTNDEMDDLLIKKEKDKTQREGKEKQENEALDFLKGKKSSLKDSVDTELLSGLKQEWEAGMSADDTYLMDYFVNQRYLEEDDENCYRESNHFAIDVEPLEQDEETYDQMESYETKYRFRFQEPDEEFIRRYPRVTKDSLRVNDDRRKELREKKMKVVKESEERRTQEIKRMKAWKKKEIMERITQLEEAAGRESMGFENMDLDTDFDPDQHDAAMSQLFDHGYYDGPSHSKDKPKFQDEDIEREIQEEYEKLDRLDDMTEGSFRYVDVFPSSYGLTTEEIFCARDTELNRWYSMKRVLRTGKTDDTERRESKNYAHRATIADVKKKILPSLYTDALDEQWQTEEDRKRRRNLKKKERRLKKNALNTLEEKDNTEEKSVLYDELTTEEIDHTKKKSKNKRKNKETEVKVGINHKENLDGDQIEQKPKLSKEKRNKDKKNNEISNNNPRKKKKGDNLKNIDPDKTLNDNNENIIEKEPKNMKRKRNNKKIGNKKQKTNKEAHEEDKLKGISDTRLLAYGANPKKIKRYLKYKTKT